MPSRSAEPRPFQQPDAEGARTLVTHVLGASPYAQRALELVAAVEAADPENLALVIEGGASLEALAVFGPVAGAAGVWRVRLLVLATGAAPREIGKRIVEAVVQRVRVAGGRRVTAELPADAVLGGALTAIRACGFRQEARIPDFFRDEVALLFLRRDL